MNPQKPIDCADSTLASEPVRIAASESLRQDINDAKATMQPGEYSQYIRRMTELQPNDSWLMPIALDWALDNMSRIESCSNRKDDSLDGPELFIAKLGLNEKCQALKLDEFSMVMLKVLLSRFQELKEQHDDGKDGKVWDRDGISDKDIKSYINSHCIGSQPSRPWTNGWTPNYR